MTRHPITRSIATLMIMGLGATPALAGIVNGGFETGVAYPSGPDNLTPGTPTPWVATSYTPDMYDNTGADGFGLGGIPIYDNMFQGMVASGGNRFIGFAASPAFGGFNESFEQTTSPLIPGQLYTVSAQLAVDDSGKNSSGNAGGPYSGRGGVNVLLDGNLIGTFLPNTASLTWESRSFVFIAPLTSSGVFEFVVQTDPLRGASYVGLDDISVVPGPCSLAILGVFGMGAARRRRC